VFSIEFRDTEPIRIDNTAICEHSVQVKVSVFESRSLRYCDGYIHLEGIVRMHIDISNLCVGVSVGVGVFGEEG
jgi:hypothetical protein